MKNFIKKAVTYMESLLTVNEVSNILKIGRSGTYKLFGRKDFPQITVGKKLLVKESELEKYLKKYEKGKIEL